MIKFKINTATQKAASAKMDVLNKVLNKTKITAADWTNILFETGCRFVEQNIMDEALQKRLLQEEALGFWDWWIVIYLEDDDTLMAYDSINNGRVYAREKQRLLTLMDTNNKFYFFLKANTML